MKAPWNPYSVCFNIQDQSAGFVNWYKCHLTITCITFFLINMVKCGNTLQMYKCIMSDVLFMVSGVYINNYFFDVIAVKKKSVYLCSFLLHDRQKWTMGQHKTFFNFNIFKNYPQFPFHFDPQLWFSESIKNSNLSSLHS